MPIREIEGPLDYASQPAAAGGGVRPVEGPLDLEQPAPRGRTGKEETKRQLGLTARILTEAPLYGATAFGDAATGIGNLTLAAMEKLGLPKTKRLTPPSQTLEGFRQAAGIPTPQTPTEHFTNIVGGAVTGGLDPVLGAVQKGVQSAFNAPKAFTAPGKPQRDTTLELHEAGVSLPPSRMEGSGPAKTLEGFAGRVSTAHELAEKNAPRFQAMARTDLNLPKDTPLTQEALRANSAVWAQQGYEPLKNISQPITIGKIFRDKMAGVLQKYAGHHSFDDLLTKRRLGQQLDPVEDTVYNALFNANGRYKQSYTAQDMIDMSRILRESSKDNFASNRTGLAKAQKEVANILEDNIDTALAGKRPELLANFRKARAEIAKSHAVEEMLVDPHTGVIDPAKAHAMLQRGEKLTGNLLTIAKAGSPVYGPSTRAPTGGSALPFELATGGVGGAGALYGMMNDNPAAQGMSPYGLALATLAAGRTGARHLLGSPFYQQRMANNLASNGGFLNSPFGQRSTAALPLGLFPMFTQGQQ